MLDCLDTVVSLAGKYGWTCHISQGFKDTETLFVLLDRGNEQVMVRIKPGQSLKVVTVESCQLRTLYADDQGELSEAIASLEQRLAEQAERSKTVRFTIRAPPKRPECGDVRGPGAS